MAVPTYLHTPAGAVYEVLNDTPDDTDLNVVFKYKISDRDTVPAWFYSSNTSGFPQNEPGPSLNWNWTDEDQTHIRINTTHTSAGWSKWSDQDGNEDVFNRSAVLGCMQLAMKDSITITSDYEIQPFYTYNTYRVQAGGDLTITLPDPAPAVQRHVNIKVDNASGVITLNTVSGNIDGQSTVTLTKSDTLQTYYNDGTNWYSNKPVGFSNDDTNPVTTLRSLTQTEYNTLTAGTGADDNTLYLIKDE